MRLHGLEGFVTRDGVNVANPLLYPVLREPDDQMLVGKAIPEPDLTIRVAHDLYVHAFDCLRVKVAALFFDGVGYVVHRALCR